MRGLGLFLVFFSLIIQIFHDLKKKSQNSIFLGGKNVPISNFSKIWNIIIIIINIIIIVMYNLAMYNNQK